MMPFRPFVLLAVLAFGAPVAVAQAQPAPADLEEHELVIRDGRMFLDGRALPRQNLPPGLDLTGLPEYTVNFLGPVIPVLEIDGVVYMLEGEHLKVLAETDRADSQVYFMPEALPTPDATAAAADGFRVAYGEEGAREREAGEEAYLRQLSSRDRSLYNQIQREQALENETLRLAGQIRSTPDGAERERLIRTLREKLDASFELKQEIRAGEIAQAEAQIEELRRLLRERAARKVQIIELRMDELIGVER